MKLTEKEFKKLQRKWYRCLILEGFRDTEANEKDTEVTKPSLIRLYRDMEPVERIAKEDYFLLLSHAVNNEDTLFKNDADRYIMTRYSEGARIIEISEELTNLGMRRERKTIRFIIRRYEMAWHIRSYNHKQLNRK
jgi:hypothetical protein